MNVRTLKKLSKRAAPYLDRIGDTRQRFRADKGENHTDLRICDSRGERKSWEVCPLKGTPMVGAVSGYYEPEWDEEPAYEALLRWVAAETMDVIPDGDDFRMVGLCDISSPGKVFRVADRLLGGWRPGPGTNGGQASDV